MPLDDYSFSKKFGWIVDQFGVSAEVINQKGCRQGIQIPLPTAFCYISYYTDVNVESNETNQL
jgi:hypothetical protein